MSSALWRPAVGTTTDTFFTSCLLEDGRTGMGRPIFSSFGVRMQPKAFGYRPPRWTTATLPKSNCKKKNKSYDAIGSDRLMLLHNTHTPMGAHTTVTGLSDGLNSRASLLQLFFDFFLFGLFRIVCLRMLTEKSVRGCFSIVVTAVALPTHYPAFSSVASTLVLL